MVVLAKTLLSAVAVTGAGASVDLTALARSLTFQVVTGGTADPKCVVEFDGSLDGATWWSLGQQVGPGPFNNDQDVVQYVRANVISLASGTVTAYCGGVAG